MTSTTGKKPAGAKKPQDHKPKNTGPKVEPVEGGRKIVHRGIKFTILDEAMDDFELLEDLHAAETGDNTRLPSLLRRLAGDDGYRAIMNGLRDKKTGRVSVETGAEFVSEVFGALNPNS